jgi:hypothetical protein
MSTIPLDRQFIAHCAAGLLDHSSLTETDYAGANAGIAVT